MIKSFPVVELDHGSATERFREWASTFGIFRLSRSLGKSPRIIQLWLSGNIQPRPETTRQIIALSSLEPLDGKPLTYEDIYGAAQASHVEVRSIQKVQAWE